MSDGSHSDDDMPVDSPVPIPDKLYPVGESVDVPNTNNQLFKKVLVEGVASTKPPKGAKVSVHYVGTLESDGSTFDSSRDRNAPFEFTLGKGEVIKGWDNGVATMNKGEKAILRCLPDYAYGASGSPPKIPANSTLNFEVELLDWTKHEDISEAKDKSLMKNVTKEGKDWDKPDYEATVTLNVRITDASGEKKLFEKKDWEVVIGETELPPALEEILKSMKAGEECEVRAVSSAIKTAAPAFGIESKGTEVVYHVTVSSFKKVKTWEFKGMDKVTQGQRRKDEGNKYFSAGDFARAERKYKRALEFIEHDYGLNDEEKVEQKKIKIAVLANQAAVQLKLNDFKGAIATCGKCLEADPSNVKALFRRGRAHLLADDWEEAKKDLRKALELEPGNADAARELELVHEKERAQSRKEKALFGNMFAKLSKMEEREKAANPTPAPAPEVPKEDAN